MRKSLTAILTEANAIDSVEERIAYLHQHNSAPLQTILKCTFDEDIKWLLPEGDPPYNASNSLDTEGLIYSNMYLRKMKMFIEGNGYDHLTPFKREGLFIAFLESIHKNDAILVLAAKNKKPPYRRVTRKFIEKCFPELITDGKTDKVEE